MKVIPQTIIICSLLLLSPQISYSGKDTRKEIELLFSGVFCGTNADQVKAALKDLDGVKRVSSKWMKKPGELSSVKVQFDTTKTSKKKITDLGVAYGWTFHQNPEEIMQVLEKYREESKFEKTSVETYSGKVKNVMCGGGAKVVKAYFEHFSCVRRIKINKGAPHSEISFEFDTKTTSIATLKSDLKILGIHLLGS